MTKEYTDSVLPGGSYLAPSQSDMALMMSRAKPKKNPDDWLSRKEAANYLASIGCPVSARSLEKRAANNNEGRGPSFTRVGWRTVKYQRRDLDAWARVQTVRIP